MEATNRFMTHDTLLSLLLAAACADVNARSRRQPPDVDALLASLLWTMEMWAHRANPRGLFAPWNPRVHC
jgi:hypothetical protein